VATIDLIIITRENISARSAALLYLCGTFSLGEPKNGACDNWRLMCCGFEMMRAQVKRKVTTATKFFYCSLRKYESDCERGACVPKSSSPVIARI
jgi:hypothetical protein